MRPSASVWHALAAISLTSAAALGAEPALTQPASASPATVKTTVSHPGAAQSGLNFGKHDSNAPININSDNFEGDFDTKVGTYVGNVVVTQADYKLRSDTLKVDVAEGKLNKLVAQGKVVFDSASGSAIGDNGVYALTEPRTITLTGHVVLTKQKDVMRGTVLVINVDTGQARLTAQGMPGNRVQSLFIPPQHRADSGKSADAPQK